jgi:hypothetical protein
MVVVRLMFAAEHQPHVAESGYRNGRAKQILAPTLGTCGRPVAIVKFFSAVVYELGVCHWA